MSGFDFGRVFTGVRFDTPSGVFFTGAVHHSGFLCYNVQSSPVAFTALSLGPSLGDPAAMPVLGWCINALCVDGTVPPRTIAPGGSVAIPVAFIPSAVGSYARTFTVLNGNGLATTTLTVTGEGVAALPVPTVGPAALAIIAAGLALSGVVVLLRR